MDSGASFHATYCKEELERFKLRSGKVRLADDKTLDIEGIGDVVLKTSFDTSWTLKDVRNGMIMLASKGSVPDVRKATAQMKCDTAFEILRVTRLSEAEILHLWTRFIELGAQIRVRGPETVGASRIVEDQMKKTLKIEYPLRREAPRLHSYEDPLESPRLRYTKSLIHLVKNLKVCSWAKLVWILISEGSLSLLKILITKSLAEMFTRIPCIESLLALCLVSEACSLCLAIQKGAIYRTEEAKSKFLEATKLHVHIGLNTYLRKINTCAPISSYELSALNSASNVVLEGN
ncbi:hypothetical protein Tco_0209885 [Tanacetum coccineum]